jgi:hypothetical protein
LPPLKFAVLKGTGFSPYIQPNNHDRALAPEGNGPAIFMVSGGTLFHARLRLLLCFNSIERSFVIGRFVFVPVTAQIGPCRVQALDERDLFRTSPSLELFFAGDRLPDVTVSLKPHQAVAVVTSRKAIMFLPFVLEDASVKVACYSDCAARNAAPLTMTLWRDPWRESHGQSGND